MSKKLPSVFDKAPKLPPDVEQCITDAIYVVAEHTQAYTSKTAVVVFEKLRAIFETVYQFGYFQGQQIAPGAELLKATSAAYHLCESLLTSSVKVVDIYDGPTAELIAEVRDACKAEIEKAESR